MNFPFLYIGLAVLSGALLPLQALINARLGAQLGNALWATLISFVVGAIALFGVIIMGRYPFPNFSQAITFPLWFWLGGLMGAFYVYVTIVSVRPLGATVMLSVIIAGQMIAALLLDHFGVLQTVHAITPLRVVGVICLIVGTIMILQK